MYHALKEAFLNPADEFSPVPFWFWNDELTEEELSRQIQDFHDKGISGFVIHPRKGLPRSIPYLSDRFMHFVRFAVEEAQRLHMHVVLYDEAMYPSGSAHGMVVQRNPEYASCCLRMEVLPEAASPKMDSGESLIALLAARRNEDSLTGIRRLPAEGGENLLCEGEICLALIECYSLGTIRGVHEGEDDGEPGAPPAADLLNPDAVDAFIELTHERYYEALSPHFGKTIIAIFTDEPSVTGRGGRKDVRGWTRGFLDDFITAGGQLEDLPALWMDIGERTEAVRAIYRRAVNHRLGSVYYGKLASWCEAHHIALTGHPAKSYDIGLLGPFQLPAQDVVWRYTGPEQEKGLLSEHSVLAKCAPDAARHRLRRRNANECFGCCGPDGVQWAFTVDDMKWYIDWLCVRGANLLFPHAFFYSVRTPVQSNERPPDVGPNSLWWPDYGIIAAYIRRLCWLMTDSRNVTPIAVLCQEDSMPADACAGLYRTQREFNYLEADLLASPACRVENGALNIAAQSYRYLLTDGDVPLKKEAADKLAEFVRQGGAVLSSPFDLSLLPQDAHASDPCPQLRVSHIEKGGLTFYLLTNEGEETVDTLLNVPVSGHMEWWNAWDGSIRPVLKEEDGFRLILPRRESLILCVDPSVQEDPARSISFDHPETGCIQPLPHISWHVSCPDGRKLPFSVVEPDENGRLPGWHEWPGMADYSGTVAYEAELHLNGAAYIDLGEAHEMTRVLVDGQEVSLRLWAPHVHRLPERGRARVRIEVRNTQANRMEPLSLPSGLIGPVRILSK